MGGKDDDELTTIQRLLASCSGALITSLLVTPLDVVKVRLQAQSRPGMFGHCFVVSSGLMDHLCTFCGGSPVTARYRFNGTLDAFGKIIRYEGVTALWSGLGATMVMAVPATMCYFTLYDDLINRLRATYGSAHWVPIVAGASARMVSASLISPLEMVRTKLQSNNAKFGDVIDALRRMVRQNGVRSLYLGLGPTLLRDVPFSAIYWVSFETFKEKALACLKWRETTFMLSLCVGAVSGSIAAVCTLPFDVIKTHRQIRLGEFTTTDSMNTWSAMQHLSRDKGLSSLFSGLVPRLVKVAPACAIMIATYDYGKLWFQQRNNSGAALFDLV